MPKWVRQVQYRPNSTPSLIGEEAVALAIGGKYANVDLVRQRARAAISAHLAALKEAGWVVMPREPTREMEAAADACDQWVPYVQHAGCGEHWRAMVEAAPAQRGDEVTG